MRLSRPRDPELPPRMKRIATTVPLGYPHFWLAALQALRETID